MGRCAAYPDWTVSLLSGVLFSGYQHLCCTQKELNTSKLSATERPLRLGGYILLLAALALGACATVGNSERALHAQSNDLTSYAQSLIGTPYRYGGNTPDTGFDCSGYVGHVYRHTTGINLPRSSADISQIGKSVPSNELRSGDLVFFNTLKRKFSHVGIYLGAGRFIHAPSSGGSVREESMRSGYWQRNYNGARRITALR